MKEDPIRSVLNNSCIQSLNKKSGYRTPGLDQKLRQCKTLVDSHRYKIAPKAPNVVSFQDSIPSRKKKDRKRSLCPNPVSCQEEERLPEAPLSYSSMARTDLHKDLKLLTKENEVPSLTYSSHDTFPHNRAQSMLAKKKKISYHTGRHQV